MPTLEMLFEVQAERNKLLVELDQRTFEAQTIYTTLKMLLAHVDATEKLLQQVYCVQSRWHGSTVRNEYLGIIEMYKHLDVEEKPAEGEVTHV